MCIAALTIEITTSCSNAWFLGNRVVHGHVTQYDNLIFLEFDKEFTHVAMQTEVMVKKL